MWGPHICGVGAAGAERETLQTGGAKSNPKFLDSVCEHREKAKFRILTKDSDPRSAPGSSLGAAPLSSGICSHVW